MTIFLKRLRLKVSSKIAITIDISRRLGISMCWPKKKFLFPHTDVIPVGFATLHSHTETHVWRRARLRPLFHGGGGLMGGVAAAAVMCPRCRAGGGGGVLPCGRGGAALRQSRRRRPAAPPLMCTATIDLPDGGPLFWCGVVPKTHPPGERRGDESGERRLPPPRAAERPRPFVRVTPRLAGGARSKRRRAALLAPSGGCTHTHRCSWAAAHAPARAADTPPVGPCG